MPIRNCWHGLETQTRLCTCMGLKSFSVGRVMLQTVLEHKNLLNIRMVLRIVELFSFHQIWGRVRSWMEFLDLFLVDFISPRVSQLPTSSRCVLSMIVRDFVRVHVHQTCIPCHDQNYLSTISTRKVF